MGIEIGGYIEKVDGKDLKYSEFVEKYLFKNQPVVLTGIMDDWGACKDWVTDNGHPNLRFFETCFGKSKVQVPTCVQFDPWCFALFRFAFFFFFFYLIYLCS